MTARLPRCWMQKAILLCCMTDAAMRSELTVCELCGKAHAAVFVTRKSGGSERRQALCLQCAEKQKIPSVREYMQQQNINAASRMCEQCGEQPATVFVTALKDGENRKKHSLCVFCARAQGIQPAADLDLSDAELREIHAEILNGMQEQPPKGFWQKLRRRFKQS